MMAEKKYYILCFEDNKLVEIDDFDDIKDVEALNFIEVINYESKKRR